MQLALSLSPPPLSETTPIVATFPWLDGSAVATGLCTPSKFEDRPSKVLLSPRNHAKSAALADKFPGLVEVAASNQAVVDGSDIVLLGVLPKVHTR